MSDALPTAEVLEALPDWRVLGRRLHLTVATEDFAVALRLVDTIGEIAEDQQHHPDLDLRWGRVHVAVSSHDVGGLSARDVTFGRAVSEVVASMGLTVQTGRLTDVELGIDALDIPAVRPFWKAVLGYDDGPIEGDLVDPEGRGASIWFQQMDSPRPQRNRIHLDVWVAPEEARPRIDAAVAAAGGTVVSDQQAPAFWVLADPEGNEACVCTSQTRG